MHLSRLWIVFLLVGLTTKVLDAQDGQGYNYAYYNFSKADGFSEINVNDFTQDKRGFIYAAAGSGLYRHNGNRWENIKSPLDHPSESVGTYANLAQYNPYQDLVYVVSLNDCQTYDPKTGTFFRIKTDKEFDEAVKLSVYFDSKIGPLITTSKGIWMVNNQQMVPWKESTKWSAKEFNIVYSMVQLDEQQIGICAKDYFGIYDKNTKKFTSYPNRTNIPSRKGILDKKRNRIWFISLPELVYFDLETKSFHIEKNSKFIHECRELTLVNEDQLWINSGTFFDIKKGQWTNIPYTDGKYSNAIQYWASLFVDQENNQWCGSAGFGANVLFSSNKWVRNIFLGNDKTNYEPYSFTVQGSDIYISNGFNNLITKIKAKTGESSSFSAPLDGPVFGLNIRQNELIGCSSQQIFSYNIINQSKRKIDIILQHKLGNIEYLNRIGDQIIVGNQQGLVVQNLINGSSHYIDISEKKCGMIHSTYIDSIDQVMYIVGIQNIVKYDIKTRKVSYPFYDEKEKRTKIQNPVSILRHKGHLWLTSSSQGLFKIDKNTFDYVQLTKEKMFFSSNFLNHIFPEGENLWIGTVEALHLFDTREERVVITLDRQHGLKRDDVTYGIAKLGDQLIKLNYSSVDLMDLRLSQNKQDQKPIYIAHFNINGQEKALVPFARDTTFYISEKDANIEMEYSLPIYSNFQHNSFSYRLLGFDSTWQHTYERQLRYNRLPVGDYTLEIKAWTANGIKINHTRKIHIVIKPLFYKTWWFISLIGLFLGSIIYLIYTFRLDKVRTELSLKSKYEQQISALEMKALRAQMNPHFVFNSLNSIQKFIFEKDEYAASQYLTKFSRLIRMILDQSNQEFISINQEMEMLKYYIDMERLRFSDKYEYTLHREKNVDENLLIPSMVIQPHVENAIWHGLMHLDGKAMLTIRFTKVSDAKAIKVVITDNGVGRAKAQELRSKQVLKNKSYGSRISEERIRNVNDQNGISESIHIHDLKDAQGNPCGTEVTLTLYANGLNDNPSNT